LGWVVFGWHGDVLRRYTDVCCQFRLKCILQWYLTVVCEKLEMTYRDREREKPLSWSSSKLYYCQVKIISLPRTVSSFCGVCLEYGATEKEIHIIRGFNRCNSSTLNSRFVERVSSKKVCAKFKEAIKSGEINNSQ